jgi:hypothetical protein
MAGTGSFEWKLTGARGVGATHLKISPSDVRIRIDRIQRPLPFRASLLRSNAREALLRLKKGRKTVSFTSKSYRKTTRIA